MRFFVSFGFLLLITRAFSQTRKEESLYYRCPAGVGDNYVVEFKDNHQQVAILHGPKRATYHLIEVLDKEGRHYESNSGPARASYRPKGDKAIIRIWDKVLDCSQFSVQPAVR